MTSTIFVVVATDIGSRDIDETNIIATRSKAKAEAHIIMCEADQVKRHQDFEMCDLIRQAVNAELGGVDYESLLDIPRWPAGFGHNDITHEMREERNRMIQSNKEIAARNEAAAHVRNRIIMEAKERYLLSRGYSINDEMIQNQYYTPSRYRFRIEVIDYV